MIDPRLKANYVSSSRAKIARADEHLESLYRETDDWADSDPLSIVRESNADGSEHLFRVSYRTYPNVWRWATLLGDALFNLRCALDHMVYALAVHETGQPIPDDDGVLAFPVTSDEPHFRKSEWRIRSLSDPTRAAIEKAQPYNRLKPGKRFMPIWWLAQLNDIDKHRMPHIATVASRPPNDGITIGADPGTYTAEWNFRPLEDGTPILRLRLANPDPDVYVDLHPAGAVAINIGDTQPWGLQPTMNLIRREVVLVCRYLAKCFR